MMPEISKARTMKLTNLIRSVLAMTLLFGACSGSVRAADAKQKKLEAKAKITKEEAQKIALGQVPTGTVKTCEIEKENRRLVWSFDIATTGSENITEVLVDAKTGKVVSVESETPADQAKEKAKDEKAKSKSGKAKKGE
jgi:hypothetical protein